MNPEFSIIIPTLNEENFLPNLLHDLIKQKHRSFEVIIVDALSIDGTKKVAIHFEKLLPISFFSVEKKNVAYQRNFGALKSSSNELVFLDADTRIDEDFLNNLSIKLQQTNMSVLIPSISPQKHSLLNEVLFKCINILIALSQHTLWSFSAGGAMVFDKKCFNKLGGFDETVFIAEDHEMIRRAHKNGYRAQLLFNISVRVSTRRFEKEGYIKLFKKYFIATLLMIKNDKINKKIFDYEMGGAGYIVRDKKKNNFK